MLMLYLVGLGLSESDVPLRAVEVLENCDSVYCEFFTNNWTGDIEEIADIAGKDIEILTREKVESDFLIKEAADKSIALLVPGDPLTATTHIELVMEAKKQGVGVDIIHASSIYTAVAETGLQLYKFGRATTIPKPQDKFSPTSPFEVIKENKRIGLHTLVLLDIGMTASCGLKILNDRGLSDINVVACCKLGTPEKIIKYGKISGLLKEENLDQSPSCLVIIGDMNFKEEEALKLWE
jgi:diphthine synthase